MMIEALIGAVLLAMATFAVLNGLEGAQATGHSNKQRTVAATLAQQDIERLRAYPIASLSNFSQTRSVNVAGVAYSVTSVTEWIRDSTDALNCTDQTGQADYVKISSTVKSPAQKNAVKEVSLLTPAAGSLSDTNGTLAVKVTDRNGAARSGVTVTLSGPGSYSKLTNTLGCAVFDYIPVATYAVGVPGMVPWAGEGSADPTATVVGGKTSLKQVEVEPPASLRAIFEKPDGTSAVWNSIEVANAKLPGGAKDFSVATATTSIDGTGLFPFLDGVGVYAGTCQRNNPASWQSNYFSTSGKGYVVLAPGDVLKTVRVQMGVLNVNVKNSSIDAREHERRTGGRSPAGHRHGLRSGHVDGPGPDQLQRQRELRPAVRDVSGLRQRHSGALDHALFPDLRRQLHQRHEPGPAYAAGEPNDLPVEHQHSELGLERFLLDRRGHLAVRRRVHMLRSDESGFTLVELLAAMSIGLIVLMGAFFLLDRATSVSQELTNRQDALQRGRLAMEKIVRDLRSQVCLGDENEPITTAENNKVTFYVDLSDGSRTIEQRTIRYVPTSPPATSPGNLYEDVYAGAGVYPTLTFTGAPQTRLLVSGVEPILDNGVPRPILRYYAFKPAGLPGDLELLTAPLVPNDAVRTVMVKVGFVVRPERKAPKDAEKTTLESDIYVRLADPSRPLEGPRCV